MINLFKLSKIGVLIFSRTINLLWVRFSNCSIAGLFTWGERQKVKITFFVGSGIGPFISQSLFLAISMIFLIDKSRAS